MTVIRSSRAVLTSLLAATLAPPVASTVPSCPAPEPFSARYETTMDKVISLSGEGTQTLKQIGPNRYRFTFDVDASVADMHESVVFEWRPDQCHLVPTRYENRLEGWLIRDRHTEFSNEPGDTVTGVYKGNPFSLPSRDHYVDPLGLQIQVRQDLKAGKQTMAYYMIHKGKVLIDRYRVVGKETLNLDGTDYDTVKIEKVRPATSDRKTFMWMAPSLNFALIRILHQEPDGERYEVTLSDFHS